MDNVVLGKFRQSSEIFQALAEIDNLANPDENRTPSYFEAVAANSSNLNFFNLYLAEKEDDIIGYMMLSQTLPNTRLLVDMAIHPTFQKAGVGTQLLNHLTRIMNRKLIRSIRINTIENRLDAITFLAQNGFHQVMRYPQSILELKDFDFSKWTSLEEKIKGKRIDIRPLSELQHNKDWQEKYWQLYESLITSVPVPEHRSKKSFNDFTRLELNAIHFVPQGIFIAIADNEWVGMSQLRLFPGATSIIQQGLTGVLPHYRRMGITTAMKLHTIRFAQQFGADKIKTSNEENNPMLMINLKMGFRLQPAILAFFKDISIAPKAMPRRRYIRKVSFKDLA